MPDLFIGCDNRQVRPPFGIARRSHLPNNDDGRVVNRSTGPTRLANLSLYIVNPPRYDSLVGQRTVLNNGDGRTGLAVPECYLTLRPKTLSWEAAGGLPLVGLTAYQSVIEAGQVKAGETILILGASGGIGSMAIQLAKNVGATVIAVASAKNAAYVKSVRADFTVDHEADSVAETVKQVVPGGVDLLFDATGGETRTQSLAAIKPLADSSR